MRRIVKRWRVTGQITVSTPRLATAIIFLLASANVSAASLYCCQDAASGRRVCADSLPEACRGRPYKILDSAGNVTKEVAAPLTPEQKAQIEADAKRRKDEEAAFREQKRKDDALLETYSELADIDRARARAEAEVLEAMKAAEAKIAEAKKTRKKFEEEAEFYKKKALPPDVEKGLRSADYEIKIQSELLAAKQQDFNLIKAKYDEDKRRFLSLRNGARRPPVAPPAPAQSGAEPRPR